MGLMTDKCILGAKDFRPSTADLGVLSNEET